MDTKAFRSLSYGLYIISSKESSGRKVACIANTFQQVASEPPMASVALNKENVTTKAIEECGYYGVSVLSEGTTMDFISPFGFKSSDKVDKFENVGYKEVDGIPVVTEDCVANFMVKVKDTVDVGTHLMFIGEVMDAEVVTGNEPLTYAYYHKALRGKTPPKAATFNDGVDNKPAPANDTGSIDGESEQTIEVIDDAISEPAPHYGWQCTFCGYIVDMEELPEDFECPICGMGREFFERVLIA